MSSGESKYPTSDVLHKESNPPVGAHDHLWHDIFKYLDQNDIDKSRKLSKTFANASTGLQTKYIKVASKGSDPKKLERGVVQNFRMALDAFETFKETFPRRGFQIVMDETIHYTGYDLYDELVALDGRGLIGNNIFNGFELPDVETKRWENLRIRTPEVYVMYKDSGYWTNLIGLDTLAPGAFKGCRNMTYIRFHDDMIKIGAEAFSGCARLSMLDHKDVSIFEKGRLTIPRSIDSIGRGAFMHCEKIKHVIFTRPLELQSACFFSCSNLESVDFAEGMTKIPELCFSWCNMKKLKLPSSLTSIEDHAFQRDIGLPGLLETDLPDSLEIIGNAAFRGSGVKKVVFPSKLRVIGESAFSACKKLEALEFKELESCLKIKVGAFSLCEALTYLYLTNIYELEERVFFGCRNLLPVSIWGGTRYVEEGSQRTFPEDVRLTKRGILIPSDCTISLRL